jgi:hypothetical protein
MLFYHSKSFYHSALILLWDYLDDSAAASPFTCFHCMGAFCRQHAIQPMPSTNTTGRHCTGICQTGYRRRIVMDRVTDKERLNAGEKPVFPGRCSQCGGFINKGRELAVDENQLLCEGCYLLMVNPDAGGDIPSKWF